MLNFLEIPDLKKNNETILVYTLSSKTLGSHHSITVENPRGFLKLMGLDIYKGDIKITHQRMWVGTGTWKYRASWFLWMQKVSINNKILRAEEIWLFIRFKHNQNQPNLSIDIEVDMFTLDTVVYL